MIIIRRALPVILVLVLGLFLTSCQEDGASSKNSLFPIYGNGGQDISEVIATVGDISITQQQLDMHYDELVPRLKSKYDGPAGQQLLLKEMVDETLLILGAQEMGLEKRSEVARTLISQRRTAMTSAMRNIGVPEGNDPTEDELQAFFNDNRKEFMQEGLVQARHIECLTLQEAEKAYQMLKDDFSAYNFLKVAKDFSVNSLSLADDTELGWYNRSGVVPLIKDSRSFIDQTFDMPLGLNRPIQVSDRWHVVEILNRKPARPMTYGEARDIVRNTMLPGYFDGMVKDYLLAARQTYPVSLMGQFTPGQGLNPDTLMERATLVEDPGVKVDYYRLIYTDFPESERADDALFMCALVCMDSWHDRRLAKRYLNILIDEYPESELIEDAVFLRDNLYNPKAMNPQSIEELRNQ